MQAKVPTVIKVTGSDDALANIRVIDGDLSLVPGHGLRRTARWQRSDPHIDIHGDRRPAIDNAPDYLGVDLP